MKNLILDCSAGMGVYLETDGKMFSRVDNLQNKHSDEVLKVIDELLSQANLTINEIQNICVCVGPGSFTGVRVAISLAKGLAIGSNAKVFTLSNFDLFDVKQKKNSYLILEGFSNFIYVRKFENGKIEDDCKDINDFASAVKQNNFCVNVTTEKTQNLLEKIKIQSNLVQIQPFLAFNKKIANNESVALNQIYPIYLRASQAEIERLKKV